MTWMCDTDIMIHLIGGKPGYERSAGAFRAARPVTFRCRPSLWRS